ncbi:hypothetical protein ACFY65_26410 [Streptomyces cellulosae]
MPAARYARSQIKEYVDGGWTLTGTDRYDDARTLASGSGAVLVTFREDRSEAYGKDIRTGKVHRTGKAPASFQKFSILMAPATDTQVWRAQQITVKGKATECGA